jgi:hypothetical protein
MFQEIKDSLRRLYLEDPPPWLVGLKRPGYTLKYPV